MPRAPAPHACEVWVGLSAGELGWEEQAQLRWLCALPWWVIQCSLPVSQEKTIAFSDVPQNL